MVYHKQVIQALLSLFVLHIKAQSILFIGLDSFRPGSYYEASVASLSNSQLSVTVSIVNNNTGQIIARQDATVLSGAQQPFSLQTPIEVDESAKYYVRVQEGLNYDNQTEIHLKRKTRSVFITTDKSIYKPGSTVKFRAFAVDVFLVPKNDPMTVEILDPKENKIKQWRDQIGQNGVVSGELELSTLTALGTWQIKVTTMGEETTETFEVEEYTLPKFEVNLSMNPSFIVSSKGTMRITAKVTAKYNIGTPVDGDLVLTVRQEREWYNIQKQAISRQISGVVNVDVTFPGGTFTTCGICAMVVEAEVTDKLTGEKRKGSAKFQTWRNLEKLEFMNRPEFIKPGLPTQFQLKLTQQDGSPLLNIQKKISVKITEDSQRFPNERNRSRVTDYSFDLPASGLLMVDHQTAPNATSLRIEAEYNGVKATDFVSQTFKSRSGNSIQIEQVQNGDQIPLPQSQIQFRVTATEEINLVFYQVLSKGKIVASGNQAINPASTVFDISIAATASMTPSATIVMYYMNSEREIIAAAKKFQVGFSLNNQVTMNWDADRKKVNESATLTVRAEPDSYISVGAVDQSVLLLSESNDITVDRVIDELDSYNDQSPISCCGPVPLRRFKRSVIWYPFRSASDTSQVLSSAGLVYMTDAFVFREPVHNGDFRTLAIDQPMLGMPESDLMNPVSLDSAPTTYVRKFFPESWLWDSDTAGPDGTATFSVTVPDTLTKWVATSFALHPTLGLGIPPQRANLTAFQPFFMSVDKPYSLVRGEEATIKIIVFNYLGRNIEATVELLQSSDFKVKENPNDVTAVSKTFTRIVQVDDQKGATVSVVVVPEKLGHLTLQLRAGTSGAADALQEPLLVEPEGRLVENNQPVFINLDQTQTSLSTSETVIFPLSNLVAGSKAIVISVIGDMLGTTLSGLGSLIRMPYGCGEQNMVSFVPNIVVRKYLESTGTISDKQITDTTKFMESGYQRELTYQRTEGSFSAFGDRDEEGSTWLTSFVVLSFKQAEPYIFIDDGVLVKALNWLITKTYSERSATFREVGNVLHEAMQGGSGNTMTAYVLIALEMCRDLNQSVPRYLEVLSAVRRNLESSIDGTSDPYNLAIMAYALQLSNRPSVDRILTKLETSALMDSGMKYWKLSTDENTENTCYRCRRQNNQVELASFVLLTYVKRRDLPSALQVARYLMSAKNPLGGFYSTQDTVWGLQALAEFSMATRSNAQQLSVTLSVGPSWRRDYTVDSTNSQIVQRYELKDEEIDGNAVQVTVDASGTGIGLVEIGSQYHTTQQETNNRLKLRLESRSRNPRVMEFTSCVQVVDSSLKDMIVVEIADPSGFPVDTTSIEQGRSIRQVEKDGKMTSIYYGDLPAGQEECTKMMAYKQNDVANVQAPVARAFGYYSGAETTTEVPTRPTNGASQLISSFVSIPMLLSFRLLWFICA